MKAVIFAGGFGTRLSEETDLRPKPMVEIGGRPILWHIMKNYAVHGISDFIVCLGYRGSIIKDYFSRYFLRQSNVSYDLGAGTFEVLSHDVEPWKVTLIDTGLHTGTAGRFAKICNLISDDSEVCVTYGDGLSNVDITATIAFHREHGKLATLTAVQPPGRFGFIEIDHELVTSFAEKPLGDGGWINGGFFVVSPSVAEYVLDDGDAWETHVLARLADKSQLKAYRHYGFWQSMDTLRERKLLENLWNTGTAPWKTWR